MGLLGSKLAAPSLFGTLYNLPSYISRHRLEMYQIIVTFLLETKVFLASADTSSYLYLAEQVNFLQ